MNTPFLDVALAIAQICASYERIGKDLASRSVKNALRKDYRRKLREIWYPLLQALDDILGIRRTRRGGMDPCSVVYEAWKRVGIHGIGLDEIEERKEYEKRMSKLCSWRECRWFTEEPPEPPKICRGCGEAVSSSSCIRLACAH